MLSNLEEQAWIARCKLLGDEKAFANLVRRYHKRILRFFLMLTSGNQDDSDDLAQETFIKVWRHMDELQQFTNFSTWLHRIAYRVFLDYTRTNANVAVAPDENLPDTQLAADASEDLQIEERSRIIQLALAQLPENERMCMVLFYMQELSIKEIEHITSFSPGTIKSCLSRGREKLRKHPSLKELIYDEKR
ncbi:MAG: RNA polymerase sigma factor [Bacteroidales bacterium]|nr:RNA polymerase sigma factor [Bacteroidales bacterium]